MGSTALALVAATALADTHVLAGRFHTLGDVQRTRALSFGGGVSVAYVFLHLLPEITFGQEELVASADRLMVSVDRPAHLVALVGLSTFYGLERAARASRSRFEEQTDPDRGFFAVHLGAFAAYSALIGYLLVRQADASTAAELALLTGALAVHFVINDVALREHHQHQFHDVIRWGLALTLLAGWGAGALFEMSEGLASLLLAFIGGAVILNVLKEELPGERDTRFWAFALGAAGYAVLLTLS